MADIRRRVARRHRLCIRRGLVLCLFQATWDGGDDSDPAYVPHDRYELVVECLPRQPA